MAEDVFGIVGTTQAGNFHVERVVAEGGFGGVYRAQHGGFRAPVALKCLKVPRSMTEEQQAAFLEKFRGEAELLFRLSASIPEVVRPLHADALRLPDDRFVPFLALEWLEGEALDGIVEKRRKTGQAPIGLHKLVRLLKPIAQALSRAHRFPGPSGPMAIVHRDLKPENIFVARLNGQDTVKVLDFGIAKCKSAATSIAGRQTGEEALNAFTPAYAAPEQWLPKRFGSTGPWTDVWGLAITMVEVLSGRPPIDGELAAMMGTAVDTARRPTPRNEGVVIAPEIDKVFERALAVDPRERTKNVETFWTELETAMGAPPSFAAYDPRREDDGPPSGRQRTDVAPSGVPPPVWDMSSVSPRAPTVSAAPEAGGLPDLDLPGAAASSPPVRARVKELSLHPTAPLGAAGPFGAEPSLAPSARPAPSGPPASHRHLVPELDAPVISTMPPSAPRGVTPSGAPLAPVVSSRPPGPTTSAPPRAPSFEVAPSVPRSRPSLRVREQLREASSQLAELGDLRDRLRVPIALIGVALLITGIDVAMAHLGGGAIEIGPVRAWWIAGPLAIAGVGMAVWRVFLDGGDG